MNELVTEKRNLSADMAHRLARLLETTPEFWLGLQQDVDLSKAAKKEKAEYRKIKPLRKRLSGFLKLLDLAPISFTSSAILSSLNSDLPESARRIHIVAIGSSGILTT